MAGMNPFSTLVPTIPNAPAPTNNVQASNQPSCNILWIEGCKDEKEVIDKILNYPTSPNTSLYFSDAENTVFWLRETDANGKIKNPLHKFPYSVEEIPFGPEANFVTKEEHKALYDAVMAMTQKLDELAKKWE